MPAKASLCPVDFRSISKLRPSIHHHRRQPAWIDLLNPRIFCFFFRFEKFKEKVLPTHEPFVEKVCLANRRGSPYRRAVAGGLPLMGSSRRTEWTGPGRRALDVAGFGKLPRRSKSGILSDRWCLHPRSGSPRVVAGTLRSLSVQNRSVGRPGARARRLLGSPFWRCEFIQPTWLRRSGLRNGVSPTVWHRVASSHPFGCRGVPVRPVLTPWDGGNGTKTQPLIVPCFFGQCKVVHLAAATSWLCARSACLPAPPCWLFSVICTALSAGGSVLAEMAQCFLFFI